MQKSTFVLGVYWLTLLNKATGEAEQTSSGCVWAAHNFLFARVTVPTERLISVCIEITETFEL